MPLYEYRCKKCGSVFEVLQRLSDEPLTKHDKCGGEVERLISPPAFQFKGSGWYITDYARGGDKHKAPSDANAANRATVGESKTETPKPAAAETKAPAKT